eukprot:12426480-Karenia_brevis.AAC.1
MSIGDAWPVAAESGFCVLASKCTVDAWPKSSSSACVAASKCTGDAWAACCSGPPTARSKSANMIAVAM